MVPGARCAAALPAPIVLAVSVQSGRRSVERKWNGNVPFVYDYWIDPPRCGIECPHGDPCFKWQKHQWSQFTNHLYKDCEICMVRSAEGN